TGALAIHIAHRHHLHALIAEKISKIIRALISAANNGHVNPTIRARPPLRAEHAAGNHIRKSNGSHGSRRTPRKLPPRHNFFLHRWWKFFYSACGVVEIKFPETPMRRRWLQRKDSNLQPIG